MIDKNIYIPQIIEAINGIEPYLVVLFGSFAYGTPNEDSDIDLMVVLKEDYYPTTFKEKQALYLKVSTLTRPIAKQVPIDLLVYTLPMYEQFKKTKSDFSQEILNKGIVIYENRNAAMA